MVVAGRALDDDDVAISMVEAGGTEASWPAFEDGAPKVDEDVLAGGLEAAKQWILESIDAPAGAHGRRRRQGADGLLGQQPTTRPRSSPPSEASRDRDRSAPRSSPTSTSASRAEAALRDELVAELAPQFADVDDAEKQLKAAFRSVTKADRAQPHRQRGRPHRRPWPDRHPAAVGRGRRSSRRSTAPACSSAARPRSST